MIDKQRARIIKQQIHNDVITAILAAVQDEEELIFALLWAQHYISNSILQYQDDFIKE